MDASAGNMGNLEGSALDAAADEAADGASAAPPAARVLEPRAGRLRCADGSDDAVLAVDAAPAVTAHWLYGCNWARLVQVRPRSRGRWGVWGVGWEGFAARHGAQVASDLRFHHARTRFHARSHREASERARII